MRTPQRSLLVTALVLLCTGTAWADSGAAAHRETTTASPAAAITEFPLPAHDRGPGVIVAGAAGKLWFTESAIDGLGVRSASGAISELFGLSGPAGGLVEGPDGDLWVTEPTANVIARVAPSNAFTEFSTGMAATSAPTAITAGADGNLWFTQATNPGRIGRITPTGTITEFTAGLTPNSTPTDITAGPDGNLWFTEAGNPGRIGRITPTGTITEFTAGLTPNSTPTDITAGPDGNLWFTEAGNPGRIGRITPTGTITEFTAGLTPNSTPTDITAGPDGNLWFTEAGNPGRIGRITPTGTITEETTPSVNSQPNAISAVSDGSLWFTEDGNHGALGHAVPTAAAPAPSATTLPATAATSTSAILQGTGDPNGVSSTYHFEWGTTAAYGHQTPGTDAALGSDSAQDHVAQTVTGLTPGTTYHYRLVVTNCGGCASGTTAGSDLTFTTAAAPALTIGGGDPVAPIASVAAPPAPGRSAVTGVVSGTVLVKVPGSSALVPLTASRNIPIGSLIDADHGTVRVTTALNRSGRTQSASVWGGSFVVHQTAKRGMTTFTVAGALSCPAPRRNAKVRTMLARSDAKKPPKKTTRSLWAHDNHGQYSTRGNNSVATVRGTWWETVDTCRGTITRVKHGLVSVRDLRRHRTVLVHAGHSYLARS